MAAAGWCFYFSSLTAVTLLQRPLFLVLDLKKAMKNENLKKSPFLCVKALTSSVSTV